MHKIIEDLRVDKIIKLNEKYYLIDLISKNDLSHIEPGQFLELLVPNASNVFLRRPFSIHNVDNENKIIRLFIQIVGKATQALKNLKSGDVVNCIFPLGKGFSYNNIKNSLIVGGGCGIAPLLFLSKKLHNSGIENTILMGFKTKNDIVEYDEYTKYGNVLLTTEDGSAGEKGYVTNHSIFTKVSNFDQIFACGPINMLKAIAKIAKKYNVQCQVSLENTMACGIGVCLCCVTKTVRGNICTCTEGPVFNINELLW